MQLTRLGVGACGVAEARIMGSGCRKVTEDWYLLWSGLPEGQPRRHGVGLLLNSKWYRCLIDWSAVSERILVVRVRVSSGINASVVVAYSPTDTKATPEEVKEAFYLQLEAVMAALPSRDMLVLMGDFNAQVGTDPKPYGGVMGPHGFGEQQPSENGERLLQLAGALQLRLANTFFKQSSYRTATHRMKDRNKRDVLRVIDYIAVSKRFMSSVTNCRVFRSFDTDSDHNMLVLTMRLRLSVAKQHSARGQAARPYNCSRLQESAAVQQCFELAMSNQFSRLAGAQMQSAQDEWTQLAAAADQAAQKAGLNLKPQQKRRDFALTDATMQKIERKHEAHAAVLSSPGDATKAAYREANNAARRAVRKDQERYFKQQALFAERALKAGNLAVFHKHVQRVFREQQGSSSAAPTAVLGGADGKQLFQSREEVVRCFAEHFADVLNCPANLDQQMQQTIEELVQQLESGQAANLNKQSEAAAEPPTVKEVKDAVDALRNGATPGVDGIAAPMLKLSDTMLKWLHRVIVAVWQSGKAPVEWKRALLVALYKGKGERKVRDSYRGISLLSIPGKVYVLVIMAKISSHIDAQLLDTQSAFRKGRGLTDALFTIRQVISKSVAFDQPLFMAFVDLRKAYDSVPRDTLWRILRVYGVHTKLIELLMDLHTGTQAAVRMGGVVSEWFDVHGGVRQGCVIAPLLFNVYMDFVVRQAMAQMPEGCGVKLAYNANGKLQRDVGGSGGSLELLSVLLYADDMVLLSPSREELTVMLQAMDKVAASLGLRINASKTEILSIDKDWVEEDGVVQQGPEVVISEGVVKEVSQFKYLGSVLVADGRLDVELKIRKGRALGRFKQFEKMWGTKHLSVVTKVKCYKAYVLPILLFGSECWALTKEQLQVLERVHTSCLRSILRVRLSDRHRNEHIRKSCGVATLSAYITATRLRWLGHVGRMERGRLPHVALFSSLHGEMKRKVGRPRQTWEKCILADLVVLGENERSWEASCQIRSAWRQRLWDLTHPWGSPRDVRYRWRSKQAVRKHAERYVVPFSGEEEASSPLLQWWEPAPVPTTLVLDPAASPSTHV
jgi:exonuclease III